MTDLESRIARLEAEREIRRLKARYLNACDSKDVAAIRGCFLAEAELDYAPMGKFTVDGMIEAFTSIAVGTPIIDTHQMHNGEIDILDDAHASGRWSLSFATYDPRTRKLRMMAGLYEDEYRRTDAGWRIAKCRHTPRLILDGELAETGLRAEIQPL